MKKWLLIILFFPLFAFASDLEFNKVVIFGDSLSDTGNLWRNLAHIIPRSPPYFHGHFSNGKMWDEVFYEHYFPARDDFADYNYAVGGASAYLSIDAPLPYTLSQEVDNYLYNYDFDDNSKVLYIIWIGGNNYLRLTHYSSSTTTNAVDAIRKAAERLVNHGANKILIANLPHMGIMPEAIENHEIELLDVMSREHNEKLYDMVESLKDKYDGQLHDKVNFVYFDSEKNLDDVFSNPDKFGMHHLDTACYTGGYTFKPAEKEMKSYLFGLLANAPRSLSASRMSAMLKDPSTREAIKVAMYHDSHPIKDYQCDDFLFWDHVHPSTHAHRYIAEYMINAVDEAGLVATD